MANVKSPVLPFAAKDYSPEYMNQLNNILRIYFNQVTQTLNGDLNATLSAHIRSQEVLTWLSM